MLGKIGPWNKKANSRDVTRSYSREDGKPNSHFIEYIQGQYNRNYQSLVIKVFSRLDMGRKFFPKNRPIGPYWNCLYLCDFSLKYPVCQFGIFFEMTHS